MASKRIEKHSIENESQEAITYAMTRNLSTCQLVNLSIFKHAYALAAKPLYSGHICTTSNFIRNEWNDGQTFIVKPLFSWYFVADTFQRTPRSSLPCITDLFLAANNSSYKTILVRRQSKFFCTFFNTLPGWSNILPFLKKRRLRCRYHQQNRLRPRKIACDRTPRVTATICEKGWGTLIE